MISPIPAPRSAASFDRVEARTRTGGWKTLGLGLLVAALIGGFCQAAPVTLYDSITGNTPNDPPDEANFNQYLADRFGTDGDSYTLNSVTLNFASVPTGSVVVDLYSDNSGSPGTPQATFTNPGSLTAGNNTFTATTGFTTLDANAFFWVVLRGGAIGDSVEWNFTDGSGAVSPAWQTMDNAYRTTLGGAWNLSASQPYMMQVSATVVPVPEPSTYAMGAAGLAFSAVMSFRRRSRRSSAT
mgnify:CR=1 FL=1